MHKMSRHPIIGYILIGLLFMFCCSPQFRDIYGLPPHLTIMEGETAVLTVSFPMTVTVNHDTQTSINLSSKLPLQTFYQPVAIEPIQIGPSVVEFRLFGLVPIRTVQVDVLPPLRLVPGGHSIGVMLHSQGVIIVGYSPVRSSGGIYLNPAKESGIVIGDVILSINGILVQSDSQVAELIHDNGLQTSSSDVEIKRGDERLHVSIAPVLCEDTKRYRIGLFVRDSAAGVGTLTFVEPKSLIFGALGHVITDSDTNQPIDCDQGKIVLATVSGIQQGKRGQPGEKIGVFIEEDQILGNIRKNTRFGIYGKMSTALSNPYYKEAIPVASMSQVKVGPAEIMTVVDGQNIEKFAIEIQKINLQDIPEGKGLVLKIVDQRLKEKTGGIVQGMSGSPIIQNDKIVGAVTHVFVHDPTKGYGCFIDWMLLESEIIPHKEQQTVQKLFSFQH